eukprot:573880-Heterocapsa_arctica.AAC.1
MISTVAEPVHCPAENNSGRQDWMAFSHALTKMLRHTCNGWSHKLGHDRITDNAGWATVGAISK